MPSLYTRDQLMAMSPEERETLKNDLLAKKAALSQQPQVSPYAQARPTLGQTLGKALLMGTQAYTTGKVPDEAFKTSTTEPDWYTKQAVEQQNKRDMARYEAELKPKGPIIKQLKDGSIAKIDPSTEAMEILYEAPPKEPTVWEKKAQLDIEAGERARESASKGTVAAAQDALNTISEVEKGIKHFGLTGGLPSIPGTERFTWETNVNNLLSRKIVDLMSEMKNASRTGATGFGQLNQAELKVLQDASTTLKRGLAPEEAQKVLNDLKSKLEKIAYSRQELGNETSGGETSEDDGYAKYLKSIGQ